LNYLKQKNSLSKRKKRNLSTRRKNNETMIMKCNFNNVMKKAIDLKDMEIQNDGMINKRSVTPDAMKNNFSALNRSSSRDSEGRPSSPSLRKYSNINELDFREAPTTILLNLKDINEFKGVHSVYNELRNAIKTNRYLVIFND